MAMCTDCGTPLPGRATSCPACGAGRRGAGWERDAGAMSVGAYPALEPDLTFAEIRLVTTPITSEGRAGQDSSDLRARPTVPSWVVRNDLALCSLVLGIVSFVFGLLGQGWFGVVAVACGHQARRQMGGHGAARAGTVLAIAGLVLGSAAIMMMLGSLVGIPF